MRVTREYLLSHSRAACANLLYNSQQGGEKMDFVERMNRAMDYIEECLGDEICPEEIARIMACPFSQFQRSFMQITGIPVSEYIRRRRLTCAAYDLQNTGEKVIDIALKYGYGSPDAFAAAFKRMHGVNPASARDKGAKLAFYCRLSFELTMKGVNKLDYKVVDKEAFKVIGKRRTTAAGSITGQALYHTWQRINQEFLPQSKYQEYGLPTIEKFTLWDEGADVCKVEISIPVITK